MLTTMRRSLLCLTVVFTAIGFYFSSLEVSQRLATKQDFFISVVQNFAVGQSAVANNATMGRTTSSILSSSHDPSAVVVSPEQVLEYSKANSNISSSHFLHSYRANESTRFAISQLEQYACLKHEPKIVNASDVMNQSFVMLEMKMRDGCGPLRRTWTDNPPMSILANDLVKHQSNCSLPVMTYQIDDVHGLGAYFTLWSRALCYAMVFHHRIRTYNPRWLWMDQTHCDLETAKRSPWLCYFPKSEYLCDPAENVTDNIVPDTMPCQLTRNRKKRATFRAATIEYMFRNLSPLVIQEAQRQSGVVFGPNGAPEDLITVHLRWGDKKIEVNPVPIEMYIDGVWKILEKKLGRSRDDNNAVANIYLATEDPLALDAFTNAAPKSWNIYRDVIIDELGQFRPSTRFNCASAMGRNTLGRGGLVNMGSLLLSMEANYFVLTTTSGFSRIINNIRTNIIDPRCGSCTHVVDLQNGLWS